MGENYQFIQILRASCDLPNVPPATGNRRFTLITEGGCGTSAMLTCVDPERKVGVEAHAASGSLTASDPLERRSVAVPHS